jgi:hypothetical protein
MLEPGNENGLLVLLWGRLPACLFVNSAYGRLESLPHNNQSVYRTDKVEFANVLAIGSKGYLSRPRVRGFASPPRISFSQLPAEDATTWAN